MSTPPPQLSDSWQHSPLPCIYNRPLTLLNDKRCTIHPQRKVLLVANGELVLLRLAELARHALADTRIQIVFTIPVPRFTCSTRLEELVTKLGLPYIRWREATQTHFDLALSSSALEELPDLACPMLILSHGPGNTKTISLAAKSANHGDWMSGRKENAPYRELILASEDERRLFPKNIPSTVIGDPVFDALINARSHRNEFREALCVDGRKLVVLSSTWHDDSLFGLGPHISEKLLASLSIDRCCIALILHPAIWITHGEWQIRTWLRDAIDAGLRLIPYEDGWQATILAADRVIGDYGSVSLYANMLGVPTCFYRLDYATLNAELTVAKKAIAAPQARDLSDIMRFIEEPGRQSTVHTHDVKRGFANLGTSLEHLSRLMYERMNLTYDERAVSPLAVHPPATSLKEPQSFLVNADHDKEGRLFPASVRNHHQHNRILISSAKERNYRICQNADAAILDDKEALAWWRDRFPTATYALIREDNGCSVIDRENDLIATVEPLSLVDAVILVASYAGSASPERAEPTS